MVTLYKIYISGFNAVHVYKTSPWEVEAEGSKFKANLADISRSYIKETIKAIENERKQKLSLLLISVY